MGDMSEDGVKWNQQNSAPLNPESLEGISPLHVLIFCTSKRTGEEMNSQIAGLLAYTGKGNKHPQYPKKQQVAAMAACLLAGSYGSHSGAMAVLLSWAAQD